MQSSPSLRAFKENKSIRSLRRGTKFKSYDANGNVLVCIAKTKRGDQRDIEIEGHEGTYSMRSDNKVELL